MDYTKDQLQESAQDEHDKAKRLQADADQKTQEIDKLQQEIDDERKKANAMTMGGAAGVLLGSSPRNNANKLEQKVSQLKKDRDSLLQDAKFAEKQAYKWEQKAKFAD